MLLRTQWALEFWADSVHTGCKNFSYLDIVFLQLSSAMEQLAATFTNPDMHARFHWFLMTFRRSKQGSKMCKINNNNNDSRRNIWKIKDSFALWKMGPKATITWRVLLLLKVCVKVSLLQISSSWCHKEHLSPPSRLCLFTDKVFFQILKKWESIWSGTYWSLIEGALQPHLPVEDHRVLAVGGGGGVGVGWLRRHGLDGDETQGAGVIFVGVWEGQNKTDVTQEKISSKL